MQKRLWAIRLKKNGLNRFKYLIGVENQKVNKDTLEKMGK